MVQLAFLVAEHSINGRAYALPGTAADTPLALDWQLLNSPHNNHKAEFSIDNALHVSTHTRDNYIL